MRGFYSNYRVNLLRITESLRIIERILVVTGEFAGKMSRKNNAKRYMIMHTEFGVKCTVGRGILVVISNRKNVLADGNFIEH